VCYFVKEKTVFLSLKSHNYSGLAYHKLMLATCLILLLASCGSDSVPSQEDINQSLTGDVTFPARAAFYYPWFPETWTVNGKHVFYNPSLSYYNTSTQAIVDAHINALTYAKIQVGIASWWGINTHTESVRIPLLLNRSKALNTPLKWTLYYEKEASSNPSVSALKMDLAYIKTNYASSPNYAKVKGKPVIFVYNANDTTCEVVNRWAQATAGQWYVVLKVFPGYKTCATQPGSWHQYAPAGAATDQQAGYSYTISPGFWRADESSARLARDLTRWKQNVLDMVASKEPWQLITTFNEWGEGTAIEGAQEWNNAYLDALAGKALLSVSINPSSATMVRGSSKSFTATVAGSTNTGVNWSTTGGTITGTGNTISYKAPTTVGIYTLTATSKANVNRKATATITVKANIIAVSISPSSATMVRGSSKSFSATVTGSTNTGVTWSTTGGTITGTGNTISYKAPTTVGTYTLTATSKANANKKATSTITVTGSTVTFAAAGDFGGNDSRAGTVMNDLKTRAAKAFLLLGDMSYDEIVPESAWCNWVHSYLGANYPMELVAGNHEEDSRVDGYIHNFTSCMPDRLNSTLGPGGYGINYAFDLGTVTVIAVSPSLTVDGVGYDYDSGSAERSWLVQQIRTAKTEGDWIVVGMHKNCITIGNKSCEIGQTFAQMLINEKVDLVLQGHDHDYQRSHSLAKIQSNAVPTGAIADNGSDNLYMRGTGTVFVIVGTVGRSLTTCSHSDAEAGYFAVHHCAEEGESKGYLLMSSSSTKLEARFISTVGSYTDTFTIR
jgi:Calcineurin-like phosphoesterase/Glycosyl hydrolase family 99